MTLQDAAHGICRVAVASMRRAVRMVTVQRGCDPRGCTLIAFGGAAPLLAASLADDLEIGTVSVPPHAGLFSALGLLSADMRFDVVAPLAARLDELDGAALVERYAARLADAADELAACGVDVTAARTERSIDLRYVRQGSEITVAVPDDVSVKQLPHALAQAFHQEHQRAYGYHRTDSAILASTVRLRVLIRHDGFRLSDLDHQPPDPGGIAPLGWRPAYFGAAIGELAVPLYARMSLADQRVAGPAIIEELDTTIVVPPRWDVTLGRLGSVVMERA